MSDSLVIAIGQMLVEGAAADRNLPRATAMISEAASRQCDFIVLPECLDLGWCDESALSQAQPVPGPVFDALAQAARLHSIYVVAGLTERDGDNVYNSSVLIAPDGKLLLRHRKLNELDFARAVYATGDQFAIADTRYGNVAIPICADLFPDNVANGHALARMGAQLLLSPCAWAVPPGHDNAAEPYGSTWLNSYGEIARRWNVPVIGASNVGVIRSGEWAGHKCIGCSLALDAHGRLLAQGPYGETAEALIVVRVR